LAYSTVAWGIAVLLFMLTGCESTGPKVDASTFELPSAYRNAVAPTGRVSSAASGQLDWWKQYGSAELDRLVDRALAFNADLRVATLQVAQAKIRADQARGGRLPTLTAPVRAVLQGQGTSSDSQQNSQVGLLGTFRLDLWGEQRALIDSADLQLQRAVHERENTQRNTIASLVNAYIAFLSVSDSILIARENEAVAADILRNTEKRMEMGDATADDLEQQRASLFSQQVILPGLENQQEDLRNVISRLVGALPANLVLSDQGLDALRLPTVQAGLPSDLLLGRPDIRMMEARMRAANANIEVARARLLPPIDLSSQAGYSANTLASLFQPQNFLANTVASLAISIFDGGVRKSEQAFAKTYYEEMVETYGKTVLQAVREVESALANLKAAARRLEAQKAVTRSALNIFKIGNDAYRAGAIDQSALLESRRNYQRNADETQRIKAEVLRSYATLSYALGFGAVLNEMSPLAELTQTDHFTIANDITIDRHGILTATAAADPTFANETGRWAVTLEGVIHRSGLLPLWRDFHTRYSGDQWLRAFKVDGIDDRAYTGEAWYRVAIVGFKDQNESISYCFKLKQQQHCQVSQLSK
jgi:NodT family efflux transporter outer membrane factor (OMF) lipoprotein